MKSKIFFTSLLFSILSAIGYSQNSLSFDGANDQVDCGNSTSLQITGTAITLEAWIYPTSWKTQVWQGNIINKEALSGSGYMLRCGATGTLNFNLGNGTSVWHELSSATNVLTLNTWQHVAGTYDGSYMRIYVNGVIVDSLAKTISIANSTSTVGVGYAPIYAGSRNFPGKIDEVRIWNVGRTRAEIAANMNGELCVIPSSVKAYYRFNQGTAAGTNTTVTSLTDLSVNGNTGTLTNLALSGATSNWVLGKALTPGTVVSSTNISACGSYTMPDGRIITTAGTYYDTLPSSTPCDSLVAYNISFPPAIIRNTINDSGCVSYTTAMGTMITTSGTYYDTVSTSGGCDTTIRYNIVISGAVDDSVYRVGSRIRSYDTWAIHQWIRCDSSNLPISGATGSFIDVITPGDYAVIITRGTCVDTSDCINFNPANIEENRIANFSIYPNPATDILSISYDSKLIITKIEIIDISGKKKSEIITDYEKIDLSYLSSGIYFLKINSNKGISFVKFIKQ